MSEPADNYIDFMLNGVLGYRGSDKSRRVLDKAVIATSVTCSETPNGGDDFNKFFKDMKDEWNRQKSKGIQKSWRDFNVDIYDSFKYRYNEDAVREVMFYYVDMFESGDIDHDDKGVDVARYIVDRNA